MIHLTPADYTRQPWKNGKGTTVELWRLTHGTTLVARLSIATVAEDGPFSLFPGIDRCLTVLSGPGFRLTGPGVDLRCDPLVPVAFAGDIALSASETGGVASTDFNVMTTRPLPRPEVALTRDTTLPAGGLLAIHAIGPCRVGATALAAGDLALTEGPVALTGTALVTRFHGLPAHPEILRQP